MTRLITCDKCGAQSSVDVYDPHLHEGFLHTYVGGKSFDLCRECLDKSEAVRREWIENV